MWEQVVIESKANQKRGPVISIKFFFPLLVPIRFPDAADCLNDTHDGGGEVKKKKTNDSHKSFRVKNGRGPFITTRKGNFIAPFFFTFLFFLLFPGMGATRGL